MPYLETGLRCCGRTSTSVKRRHYNTILFQELAAQSDDQLDRASTGSRHHEQAQNDDRKLNEDHRLQALLALAPIATTEPIKVTIVLFFGVGIFFLLFLSSRCFFHFSLSFFFLTIEDVRTADDPAKSAHKAVNFNFSSELRSGFFGELEFHQLEPQVTSACHR
jgi:hypothetical protein